MPTTHLAMILLFRPDTGGAARRHGRPAHHGNANRCPLVSGHQVSGIIREPRSRPPGKRCTGQGASRRPLACAPLRSPGLERGFTFDAYFTSDLWGRYKPHPDIYLKSVARFGFRPDEVIHVCRVQLDVQGGRRPASKWLGSTEPRSRLRPTATSRTGRCATSSSLQSCSIRRSPRSIKRPALARRSMLLDRVSGQPFDAPVGHAGDRGGVCVFMIRPRG
jgi:hypothetical protein